MSTESKIKKTPYNISKLLFSEKDRAYFEELIEEAKFQKRGGKVADYIPELRLGLNSKVGISLYQIGGKGKVLGFGDHNKNERLNKDKAESKKLKEGHIDENKRELDDMFTIQSISKVLALLYVLEEKGADYVFKRVGKEPTGDPFNATPRIRNKGDVPMPYNPLINVGAILITSMFPSTRKNQDNKNSGKISENLGKPEEKKFNLFFDFVKELTGDKDMIIDQAVFESESNTGHNNRSLAWKMDAEGIFRHDPSMQKNIKNEANKQKLTKRQIEVDRIEKYLDNYFRQCSILVHTNHLAKVAGILANGGIDPDSGNRLAAEENVHTVVSLMSSCGVYDGSGEFAQEIGIPAKSGVGGGIMAVVPGKMGIATYCPALDVQGNSIRGMYMLQKISEKYNFSVFYQKPIELQTSGQKITVDKQWLQNIVDEVSIRRIPYDCKPFENIPKLESAKANCLEVAVNYLNKDTTVIRRTADTKIIDKALKQEFTSFTLQSISNVFALLYVLQNKTEGRLFDFVGKEPSGESFKDVKWIDAKSSGKSQDIPFNPMINAGAIILSAMIPKQFGETARVFEDFASYYSDNNNITEDFEDNIIEDVSFQINKSSDAKKNEGYIDIKDFLIFIRRLLGNQDINVDKDMFDSERSTGYSNRAIAWEMNDRHVFDKVFSTHYFKDNKRIDNNDIEDILGVYFQLCSIEVTVKELAHFAAILANGGKDLNSETFLLSPREVAIAISLMSTSGLYDGSGEFSCAAGIPAKSGASGGILSVVPGKMGIATYSPTVDPKGNSFFGMELLKELSKKYNLSIFPSK